MTYMYYSLYKWNILTYSGNGQNDGSSSVEQGQVIAWKFTQLTHEPFASQSTQYLLSSSRSICIKRFWHFSCICLERSFSMRDVIFVQWWGLTPNTVQSNVFFVERWPHARTVKYVVCSNGQRTPPIVQLVIHWTSCSWRNFIGSYALISRTK